MHSTQTRVTLALVAGTTLLALVTSIATLVAAATGALVDEKGPVAFGVSFVLFGLGTLATAGVFMGDAYLQDRADRRARPAESVAA